MLVLACVVEIGWSVIMFVVYLVTTAACNMFCKLKYLHRIFKFVMLRRDTGTYFI